MNIRDGLKNIGAPFLSTREVSSQECVYRCMPELWLRKIFPKTVFVNADLPDKRVRVTKTTVELDALDDDSTDIYKSNIIERYSLRLREFLLLINCVLQSLLHSIIRIIKQTKWKQKILNLMF